jgi:GntR family transcriptional regulator/MocR family aminotransferase
VDIHISLEGRRDLAGQIYRQFRDAIRDGRLKAGQILPPSRELSRRLAVSRNTVGVANDRLIGEGFIEIRIGAGTYVCEHSGTPARPGPQLASQELRSRTGCSYCGICWTARSRPAGHGGLERGQRGELGFCRLR